MNSNVDANFGNTAHNDRVIVRKDLIDSLILRLDMDELQGGILVAYVPGMNPTHPLVALDDQVEYHKELDVSGDSVYVIIDLDGDGSPYKKFKNFWSKANKTSVMGLFFTDTRRCTITSSGTLVRPTGTTREIRGKEERDVLYNSYFHKVCLPWITKQVAKEGYKVVCKRVRYSGSLTTWGVVVNKTGE